jgi:hypothetical protein
MIALDNGDKIQGDASTAAKVDYTLHGLAAGAIAQLSDGQLPDSKGDLYTASGVCVLVALTLVNTDSSAITVNLYLLPSGGTARRLIPVDLSLEAGYSLVFDGQKFSVMDTDGQILYAVSAGTPTAHHTSHEAGGSDEVDAEGLFKRIMIINLVAPGESLATGDGAIYVTIPEELNGYNLLAAHASVVTVSASGTPTYMVHNETDNQDMLDVAITIDENEHTSYTAATPPSVDTDHDDVATGDILRIDKDVAGDAETDDCIILVFQLP